MSAVLESLMAAQVAGLKPVSPKSLAEAGVVNDLFTSDDVHINRYTMAAGSMLRKHVHDYSHLSAVLQGSVDVMLGDGAAATYKAGDIIFIPAGVLHTIRACTDAIWACIHSTKVE